MRRHLCSWRPRAFFIPTSEQEIRALDGANVTPPRFHSCYFQKGPSQCLQPPLNSNGGCNKEIICPPTSSTQNSRDRPLVIVDLMGASMDEERKGKVHEMISAHSADDMWESLVLASPQMHRINERAEAFINKFRAEMMLQEKLARHL